SAPSLEGYLFPETYKFSPQTPAKEVVKAMLKQFKHQTRLLDLAQSHLNPHEVVILASIVEKETGAKWERPTIAGVYLNRLRKKMRLQADPTTIYGIWKNYNGNLRKKHLLKKTPYNTYRINGLPLGPIANPSLAAIKAVLEPQEHSHIYFVSKNDGTHVFTPTYKKHLKAVEYWQKNRRNRKGKSWRDLKQKK
ncbi:MAG: endolytic transglycosylase MltG, partial [Halobacteriovoraceae bacterium]|nr:endolytic transglycosylase MltG [Halobacteriovoraceae bacterium]